MPDGPTEQCFDGIDGDAEVVGNFLILFFFVEYGFYNFTGLGRHVFDVLSDLCEYLFIEFGVFLIFNCKIMQLCTAAKDVFIFPEIDAFVFDRQQ